MYRCSILSQKILYDSLSLGESNKKKGVYLTIERGTKNQDRLRKCELRLKSQFDIHSTTSAYSSLSNNNNNNNNNTITTASWVASGSSFEIYFYRGGWKCELRLKSQFDIHSTTSAYSSLSNNNNNNNNNTITTASWVASGSSFEIYFYRGGWSGEFAKSVHHIHHHNDHSFSSLLLISTINNNTINNNCGGGDKDNNNNNNNNNSWRQRTIKPISKQRQHHQKF
ncbi:hypothetical protein Glove_320g92 [Diversispora epigaea]|uniref:Uncharacterized protein n=1 Tax=Diversispora epigaea TaxID=1348612 RepID=A0A397HUL5_9GLOM|nr:hypothetical protein Glove_320g92 [Diversispora epigaea]